jgi:hypothetical protein
VIIGLAGEIMRITLAIALIAAGTASAAAESAILAETPLGEDHCQVVTTAKTDPSGEPLAESDWYPSGWRCGGHAGRFAYVAYDDAREGLAFAPMDTVPESFAWHGKFGAWSGNVEWRGETGAQAPLAAIARYSWSIQDGDTGKALEEGSELAVFKVGATAGESCILAWVDAVANPDALDIARRHADSAANTASCEPAAETVRLGKPPAP